MGKYRYDIFMHHGRTSSLRVVELTLFISLIYVILKVNDNVCAKRITAFRSARAQSLELWIHYSFRQNKISPPSIELRSPDLHIIISLDDSTDNAISQDHSFKEGEPKREVSFPECAAHTAVITSKFWHFLQDRVSQITEPDALPSSASLFSSCCRFAVCIHNVLHRLNGGSDGNAETSSKTSEMHFQPRNNAGLQATARAKQSDLKFVGADGGKWKMALLPDSGLRDTVVSSAVSPPAGSSACTTTYADATVNKFSLMLRREKLHWRQSQTTNEPAAYSCTYAVTTSCLTSSYEIS